MSPDAGGGDARERLIDSAFRLLSANPYPAVGVKALCDRAEVQKGSFYHFFASKEDLTIATLNRSWERFRRSVLEPVLATHDGSRPLEVDLWVAWTEHQEVHSPGGCLFVRLAASVTESEVALHNRLTEVFTEWATLLGGGEPDWDSLARTQGRMLLSFTMQPAQAVTV